MSLEGTAIALLPGDLALSLCEDQLSGAWAGCLDDNPRAFRVISAFWRIMQNAAENHHADIILMDLGPNLGAINRAALIAADYIITPLSPDVFSLQGLHNLGSTLVKWRKEWQSRLNIWEMSQSRSQENLLLPSGAMQPAGYIVLQRTLRLDHPVKAHGYWLSKIPEDYRTSLLGENIEQGIISIAHDQHCLALLEDYHNFMSLAQEAHKPMFHLKPAEGAVGSHMRAVQKAYKDFRQLARNIAQRINLVLRRR